MAEVTQERAALLVEWAKTIAQVARGGVLGDDVRIQRIDRIAGPRAGALHVWAGVRCGPAMRILSRDSHAILRQTIPWEFSGSPVAFMSERVLRLEAGWPARLAQDRIRLSRIGQNPNRPDRWIAGVDQYGRTISLGLDDRTPHYLYAGTTGSGKSVGLQCAVLQLSRYPENEIVLVDGKHGESLGHVAHVPGVVGPVATDVQTARAALGWAAMRMRERYECDGDGRTIVVFDEFQEMIGDQVIADLFRKLASQGRAARVHMLAATQHPAVDVFGHPATRRCFTGKAAFMVDDAEASRVAVGGASPRADRLLGSGDGYAIAPGACHRIQGALVDGRDFSKIDAQKPKYTTWPEYRAEDVGQDLVERDRSRRRIPSDAELANGIISAMAGDGRRGFRARFEDGRPGSDRADWILDLCRRVWERVEASDEIRAMCACLVGTHT